MKKSFVFAAAVAALCIISCEDKYPSAPAGAALFDSFCCDATPVGSDDFSASAMDTTWWYRSEGDENDASISSLSDYPGYLRLSAHKGFFLDADNSAMIAQKLTDSVFTVQARVIFDPAGNDKAAAGLVLFKMEQQRLFLSVCSEGVRLQHMELFIDMIEGQKPRITEDVTDLASAPLRKHSFVDLKAECDGSSLTFSWSTDGKKWNILAENVDAAFLKAVEGEIRGPKVCLTALR